MSLPGVLLIAVTAALWLSNRQVAWSQEKETSGQTPSLGLTCETYCSRTKLRTVNAQIRWIDPNVTLGERADATGGPIEQQLQTTVFRDGFTDGRFATFPSIEPSGASPQIPPARDGQQQPPTQLRPFDLRIVGVTRPKATGEAARDLLRLSPEQRASSVIVEGLEPGLTYRWRIRYRSNSDWQTSEAVICRAPICPADMREER
jgi:hypothetical protein